MDPSPDQEDLGPDPTFLPWDGRRVPVTLLGGYLGAGKTTVLNQLLARTEVPVAVLVNDVGSVNIDAKLVARRHGDTVELTDGCVCCSLSRGLADAFDTLRARPEPPQHVVVELSGVADPHRVTPWADSLGFRLDGVVVLADADQVLHQLESEYVGDHVRRQLEAADLVVVTKTDLVDAARVTEVIGRLGDLVPGCLVVRSGEPLAAAGLLQLGGRQPGGVAATPPPALFDVHRVEATPMPVGLDRAGLDRLLDELPTGVVRAKGVVALADGTRWIVQVVGSRRQVTPLPESEMQEPTELVVIRVGP
ncbi:MAG: hypothetical protein GY745_17955 [Actinomycetia bacterium]|nr:hypothetical protein [Actinomycetes bacterium]MCP3911149.1 hypothetical protein [Actinomycetes bacterium]MCP4086915.1 hypothetical protein [Actinomycetes bacterium]